MTRLHIIGYILIGFGLIEVSSVFSQTRSLTNLEVLSQLVEEAVVEFIEKTEIDSGVIINCSQADDGVSGFIQDQFLQGLAQLGIQTRTTTDSAEQDVHLKVNVTKASVRYEKFYRRGFWSKGWIQREAELNILLKLIQGQENEVDRISEISKNRYDDVPMLELDYIEQNGFLIGRPNRPHEEGIRKWLEPAVVVTAIGGAVYLFYSIRSK